MKRIWSVSFMLILTMTQNWVMAQDYFEWLNNSNRDNTNTGVVYHDSHYYISHSTRCESTGFLRHQMIKFDQSGQIVKESIRSEFCDSISINTGLGNYHAIHNSNIIQVSSFRPPISHHLLITEYDTQLNLIKNEAVDLGRPQGIRGLLLDHPGNRYILYDSLQKTGRSGFVAKLNEQNEVVGQTTLYFQGRRAADLAERGKYSFEWMPDSTIWVQTFAAVLGTGALDLIHYIHILDRDLNILRHIHEDDLEGLEIDDRDYFAYNEGCVLPNGNFIVSQHEIVRLDSPINIYRRPVLYCYDVEGELQWKSEVDDDEILYINSMLVHPETGDIYFYGDCRHVFYKPEPRTNGVYAVCLGPNGQLKWKRKFYRIDNRANYLNGTSFNFGGDGIVITGIGGLRPSPNYNAWLLKLDENGCPYPNCEGEEIRVDVDELIPSSNFEIYPNPTSDYVHLGSENMKPDWIYQVFNLEGSLILTNNCNPLNTKIVLPHSGLYTIRLLNEQGEIIGSKKVVRY